MLDIVIAARQAEIAPGFAVKRLLPYQLRRMVGPFIFMDHGGPVAMPAAVGSQLDVLPHPHIGLSTVSYLFSGEVTHRDSLGADQAAARRSFGIYPLTRGPFQTRRRPAAQRPFLTAFFSA